MLKLMPPKNANRLSSFARILLIIAGCCLLSAAAVLICMGQDTLPLATTRAVALPSTAPQTRPPDTAAPQEQSPLPQIAPEIIIEEYATLRMGDDNADVERMQIMLMELGYLDSDEPSTKFNLPLQEAVRLFQRAAEMDITGTADSEMQRLLYSADAPEYSLKPSDAGADVLRLQKRLGELGYYQDKPSGFFGTNTRNALMQFQSGNGLPPTGKAETEALRLIYSEDALVSSLLWTPEPTPTPTPTPIPTPKPTPKPTVKPTTKPTAKPTAKSTTKPTAQPTAKPTTKPTAQPTAKPTSVPTPSPTLMPGQTPAPTPNPTDTPNPTNTPKSTNTPKPTNTPNPAPPSESGNYGGGIDGMIACAESRIGCPYVWADEGPNSFDCSGLVYYCLKKVGVSVSRQSAESYSKNEKWGKVTSIGDLKRGDLLFFRNDTSSRVSHTAIYIGGGQFIHASSSAGAVVKSSFGAAGSYWVRNFVCGRRPFD